MAEVNAVEKQPVTQEYLKKMCIRDRYGRTREELYDKVLEAREQIEDNTFRRSSPTVKEYCEKWLLLQSAQVDVYKRQVYGCQAHNSELCGRLHRPSLQVLPELNWLLFFFLSTFL